MYTVDNYDVIVIGGGHAGCEAALAAARMGHRTLMATISLDNIALMPCNPAVGGPGKSHLVLEVDALGGQMGINADATAIQMRMLNMGKGPAVHSLRCQSDKVKYQHLMKQTVENTENLNVKQIMVTELKVEDGKVTGIVTELGEFYGAKAVILCTGTYLKGKILIGDIDYVGGPNGQRVAEVFSQSLLDNGIELMRFKTGTPARVDKRTLNFENMVEQAGDAHHHSFSYMDEWINRNEDVCWLTYTNEKTHEIIHSNIHRAPMYSGKIEGVGPRYCPSIEDKVVRFADKERHQLFVEPEGTGTNEMYVQGMSTSLPMDVQYAFLRTIPGLENVEIMRPAYAIEYDCLNPTQLTPALQVKHIEGLYSAGQANGTSGYEEAAAQGLLAGINAGLYVQEKEAWYPRRDQSYTGVLVDDLCTLGTKEPYRVFTSRAEYRLLLREDNADIRLTPIAHELGLIDEARWARFNQKMENIEQERQRLRSIWLHPRSEYLEEANKVLGSPLVREASGEDLLRRPEMTYDILTSLTPYKPAMEDREAVEQVEIAIKYQGYIEHQQEEIEKQKRHENTAIPANFDYSKVSGLSNEVRAKLEQHRPVSIGQASRISGVTPAAISIILVNLKKQGMLKRGE